MQKLLHFLVSASPTPQPVANAKDWAARHQTLTAGFHTPVGRAVAGGFAADRVGYAFVSGYLEAMRQLIAETGYAVPGATPTTPATELSCLCATEDGGAHPRAILTKLAAISDGSFELSGKKLLVTFGTLAKTLLIVANDGTDEKGRPRLVLVRIPANRPGVNIHPQPELPFIPEIPHASVDFANVSVKAEEKLPGDGYERYLKPFRTVEDCHVIAALLGYLVQIARRSSWPRPIIQELLMLITAGCGLAAAPPLDVAVHVTLGGWLERINNVLNDCTPFWPLVDDETRTRWERDRMLLRVAHRVRTERLAAAWQRLE